MPGRLNRLYTFARSDESRALENFTTEALAAAIEVDSLPLLRALPAAVASPSPFGTVEVLSIRTQAPVDGGIIDLVVEVLVDGEMRSADPPRAPRHLPPAQRHPRRHSRRAPG